MDDKPKLPSEKWWNDTKVMMKHWEDVIRADERKKWQQSKVNLVLDKLPRVAEEAIKGQIAQQFAIQKPSGASVRPTSAEVERAYAKGVADTEKRLTSHLELKALEKAYKKGQADLIEKLTKYFKSHAVCCYSSGKSNYDYTWQEAIKEASESLGLENEGQCHRTSSTKPEKPRKKKED